MQAGRGTVNLQFVDPSVPIQEPLLRELGGGMGAFLGLDGAR